MNGKDGANVVIVGIIGKHRFQLDNRKRALPIVCMENIRNEIDMRQNAQHGTAEKCKAFAVILASVQIGTLKIILFIEKIDGHTVFFELEDAAIEFSPGKRHGNVA